MSTGLEGFSSEKLQFAEKTQPGCGYNPWVDSERGSFSTGSSILSTFPYIPVYWHSVRAMRPASESLAVPRRRGDLRKIRSILRFDVARAAFDIGTGPRLGNTNIIHSLSGSHNRAIPRHGSLGVVLGTTQPDLPLPRSKSASQQTKVS